MSDNTILIAKYVRKIMLANEELMALISSDNIYPLMANENTKFPFIVYARSGLVPEDSKVGVAQNDVTMLFYVVSDEYVESLDIANALRHALEYYHYKDDDIKFDIRFNSITESTSEDSYIQELEFTIKAC